MPVTKNMVEKLISILLKELKESETKVQVNFRRDGELGAQTNKLAQKMTQELRKSLYLEGTAYEHLQQFKHF